MRKFFTLLLFATVTFILQATPIKLDQARKAALQFITSSFAQTKATAGNLQLVWSDAGKLTKSGEVQINPTLYVFNLTEGSGFVIISGDDVAFPVIGYSDRYHFENDQLPTNLKAWLMGYAQQINWMRAKQIKPALEITKAWSNLNQGGLQLKSDGGLLLTTALWDQMTPYNDLCPTVSGQKTPTGCVATSTSIVMKYHAWPARGNGSYSYVTETNKISLSADFNTNYDWSNMPMTYKTGSYTAAQAANVAKLMYDVGIFSQMDYNVDDSGAETLNAAIGLVKYMKYDIGLQVLEREYYQSDEWNELVKNELNNNRPVIYGGENSQDEGHQFVLDGYNTSNYYHVNWGWSGTANGYYLLDVLDPDLQGTGGNIGGFSLDQDAMFGVQPLQAGSSYRDVIAFFAAEEDGQTFKGLETSTSTIESNTPFTVVAGFIGNLSIRDFSGNLCVALTDAKGNVKEWVSDPMTVSIGIDDGIARDFSCQIKQPIAQNDQLRLMYKSSDASDWQWVRGGSESVGYLELTTTTANEAITTAEEAIRIVLSGNESLQISSVKPIDMVTMYDITGRQIKKSTGQQSTMLVIPWQNYSKGIYLIEVIAGSDRRVQKILKR